MLNLAKAFVVGNLVRDPEFRYTPNGTAVCEFCVAVNRRWRKSDGTERSEVSFIDCQAWTRQAEIASQFLKKGYAVFVEGRLSQDRWKDLSGQNRSRIKVVVERMCFLEKRDGSGAETEEPETENSEGGEE